MILVLYTDPMISTTPPQTTISKFHNSQTSDPVTWSTTVLTSDATSENIVEPSNTAHQTPISPSTSEYR